MINKVVSKNGIRRVASSGFVLASLLGLCAGEGGRASAQTASARSGTTNERACQDAGRAKLGQMAEVLRCGYLSDSGAIEALAVVPLKSIRGLSPGCIPVSRLAILRLVNGNWQTALDAEHEIRNPVGYVGLEYIDDSYQVRGYCLVIGDRKAGSREPFSLSLGYITLSGDFDGVPTDIGWNPKAGRYQELAGNDATGGFSPEVKDPPHRKVCCSKGK